MRYFQAGVQNERMGTLKFCIKASLEHERDMEFNGEKRRNENITHRHKHVKYKQLKTE